jgi:hypothetical protein
MQAADADAGSVPLAFFLQFTTCRLQMRNAGSVPVEGVSVEWACEEGEAPYLAVETEELGASLPLHPGQLLTAPLRMRGQLAATSCRTEDCLSVAGSESRWSASGQNFIFASVLRVRIRIC